MEITRLENLPPPPGIINSIRAGFDSIANKIGAIFLPMSLNIFLWLGPRLEMETFYQTIRAEMMRISQTWGFSAEQIEMSMTQNDALFASFNLFSFLRTLPIGTSSLFAFQEVLSTPAGEPIVWQVNGFVLFFGTMILMFVGWLLGAVYFRAVAWVAIPEDKKAMHILNTFLQTILISIFCSMLFFVFFLCLFLVFFQCG
jgi:hypothetical protein